MAEHVFTKKYDLPFGDIMVDIFRIGEDYCVQIQGGERPHIGTAVLAEPRASLTGNGTVSATSSVINRIGHKDEAICRRLAEKLCMLSGSAVLCTGGYHIDNARPDQLEKIMDTVGRIEEDLKKEWEENVF